MPVTVTLGPTRLAITIGRLSGPAGLEPRPDDDAVMAVERSEGERHVGLALCVSRPGTLVGGHSDGRHGGVTATVLRSMFAASRGRRVARRSGA
jgi:hypothetical protein